jgi:hypothetical protein
MVHNDPIIDRDAVTIVLLLLAGLSVLAFAAASVAVF